MTGEDLVDRARKLAESGGRRILGITGAPGAGKTTVAHEIVGALGPGLAVLVPMDGFVHLLRRLRTQREAIVHAPDFDRDVDESIGSALPIARGVPLIVTEGNYLLCDRGGWAGVAPLLDESWFLEAADALRQRRLVRRHQLHGMTAGAAVTWAGTTDQDNAEVVAATRTRADLIVPVTGSS